LKKVYYKNEPANNRHSREKKMDKKQEKYDAILKEFYEVIPSENKIFYEELAGAAIQLGYVPSRDKTKCISISFQNSKTKFAIMKFAEETKKGFKLRFAANKKYSKIFDESVKQYSEKIRQGKPEKDFKNSTCFGCGKCGNHKKLFYTINYDDGRKHTVCGNFFIHINTISKKIAEEAAKLMQTQHEALIAE